MISKLNILVDASNAMPMASSGSPVASTPSAYCGTALVVQMTVIKCWDNPTPVDFGQSCGYVAMLGDEYGADAEPLVVVDDGFNDIADWSEANRATGHLCFQLPLGDEPVQTAMGSSVTKSFYIQVWAKNANGASVIILSCNILLKNVAVEAPV